MLCLPVLHHHAKKEGASPVANIHPQRIVQHGGWWQLEDSKKGPYFRETETPAPGSCQLGGPQGSKSGVWELGIMNDCNKHPGKKSKTSNHTGSRQLLTFLVFFGECWGAYGDNPASNWKLGTWPWQSRGSPCDQVAGNTQEPVWL
jgi:hypothetical protein